VRIVAISDVHGKFNNLVIPDCDLLVSCGDYSFTGQLHEVRSFHKWMGKQPAKHKISLQGNHEKGVQAQFDLMKSLAEEFCPGVHFMEEGGLEIEGFKIWLSAYTPTFFNWAYMKDRGAEIKEHCDRIPTDTEILITHGPAYGIRDTVLHQHPAGHIAEAFVGCQDLANRIKELTNLKAHFFGHIHEAYGSHGIHYNVSICDEHYKPNNKPLEIELHK
jgi:Icc-related predicted phosphoesterase